MKTFAELKEYLLEHVHVPANESPKFQKLSNQELQNRPITASTASHRFNIHKREDGDSGIFTVHDKETGEHVGSLVYSRHQKNGHILSEVTKDPSCKHGRMMPEVIAHLHDHTGAKMFSSTSLTSAGASVWKHLAKTHNVLAVSDKTGAMKKVASNLTPGDIDKHREKVPAHKAHTQFWLGDSK
mgnify:FL=1